MRIASARVAAVRDTGRLFAREWRGLLAPFCMDLSWGLFGLGLPLFLKQQFGLDESGVAWVNAAGWISYLGLCPLFGRLVDRGWRSGQLLAAPLVALVALGVVASGRPGWGLWQVYIGIFIYYAASAMFWPSLITTISRSRDSGRVLRRITVFNSAWIAGYCVGSELAGVLNHLHYAYPFFGCGVFMIFLLPIVVHTERHHQATALEEPRPTPGMVLPNVIRQRWMLRIAWTGLFFATGGIATARTLYPVTAVDLGLDSARIGLLMLLTGLGQWAGFLLGGVFPRWWYYRFWPLGFAQVAMVGACVAMGFLTHYSALSVAMLAAGFGASIPYLMSITYCTIGTDNPGVKSGIHEGLIGAGALAGPLLSSQIAGGLAAFWSHAGGIYVLAAALVTAALLAQLVMLAAMRKAERSAVALVPVASTTVEEALER